MTIPHVIHQSWQTEHVPPEWLTLTDSWRRHHPAWEHRLWTDTDNQRLVDEHYPQLAAQYAACQFAIQRADVARYLILHKHGGVYVDLDVECLRAIDSLVAGQRCVLSMEPRIHAEWINQRRLVSNAFMAAVPSHQFFNMIIEMLRTRELRGTRHVDVLASTGPILVSQALARHVIADVMVLPAAAFSPFNSRSEVLAQLRDGVDGDSIRAACIQRGVWGIHYWSNSWARNLAGELVNPDPDGIPGYLFYPGMDSPSHDLGNGGRDIARLAEKCDADVRAAGFNTDGFLKSVIRPFHAWVQLPHAGPGQGLYVKRAFRFGG